MLTDLVKHNHLGNIDNILFVLQNVITENPRKIVDIKKYCSDKTIDLVYSIDGILSLLEFLEIISRSRNSVKLNKNTSTSLITNVNESLIPRILIEKIFTKINEESSLKDFISLEKINFDPTLNQISIQNNSIPLQYSSIKNLLIELGGLNINSEYPSILLIDKSFQSFFEAAVVPWLIDDYEKACFSIGKFKLSPEKFLELQDLKNQYGAQAEDFILEYEKNRLVGHPLKDQIRRISNFDVNAGYDIVSFENLDSKTLDRLIEVKSFSKYPEFYWSKNEVQIAELKRKNYFLYLVDRDQIGIKNYQPIIVQDPYLNIFQHPDWQKDPQSWLVKRTYVIPTQKKQNVSVFISYSHENKLFAMKLAKELEKNGIKVWWDYSALKGGQDWQREIQKAITDCQYFLVVLTPEAVLSEWVSNEITLAINKGKKVIPLYLKQCEVPLSIIRKQYINFEEQLQKAAINELIDLLEIHDQN